MLNKCLSNVFSWVGDKVHFVIRLAMIKKGRGVFLGTGTFKQAKKSKIKWFSCDLRAFYIKTMVTYYREGYNSL